MVTLRGISILDDGYKRVKFKYRGNTYTILILPTVKVDTAITKYVQRINDGTDGLQTITR